MKKCWPLAAAALLVGCGGSGSTQESIDPGKLWVQPSPATITTGAQLDFRAVPDVHSEAPLIMSTAWAVVEASGGTVIATSTNGQFAHYTAPMTTGTFHLQAISNFGMARYLPQPGTIHVIDPSLVTIATSTSQVTMVHNYSGPVPVITALATPITNAKVLWFIVEPGFTGPGLINLIPDFTSNRCEVSYGGDAGLDRLPGKLFHIRIQSVEVPTVWADIPVTVQ